MAPRIVTLALGASLVGGCYLSHGRGERDGAVEVDARTERDASVPIDAGPPIPCALEPRAVLQATDTPFSAHSPELGWDGERIGLVVFESDGSIPHPIVSATRIAPDLSGAEPLRLVGEESHSWGEAAWDARGPMAVCWNGDPGPPSRTLFRLWDRAGAELSPRVDLDLEGGACEGLVRTGDRWAAVWRHGRDAVAIQAAVLDDRGAIVGTFDLEDPVPYPGRPVQLAADRDGFVVAQAREGEGVVLFRGDRDGWLRARAIVPAPQAQYAALAVHDDGTVGLVIRDGARADGSLRFVRTSSDLAPLPGETLLVSDGRGARHPRVAAMPDGWAVMWVEEAGDGMPPTGALLAHLDRAGVPIEPRRALVQGTNSGYGGPALLPHAGELYVAIARPPDGGVGHEQAFVHRLECGVRERCAPLDARSSGDDCARRDGYAWDGGLCAPIDCGCIGTECDRIAATEEECLADHEGCLGTPD